MKEKKERPPITVYHVHFFDNLVNEDLKEKDFYFGSISAICETFNKSRIGIVASSLYNLNLDEIKNPVYENKLCRIKKSILITKSKSK